MRRFLAPLGVASLAVLAFAGTPCPDPLSAQVIDGQCAVSQCYVPRRIGPGTVVVQGYLQVEPSVKQGGCKTPGTNSVQCAEAIQPTTYRVPQGTGMGYDCTNGQSLFEKCYLQTDSFIRIDGRNIGTPCDYCGSNNN